MIKFNASEAALIYKDESKAQKLLSEAQSLLFSLPQGTHQEQYEYQQLEKSIQERINQIYHITQIDSPQHLVSLQELMGISSNLFLKIQISTLPQAKLSTRLTQKTKPLLK